MVARHNDLRRGQGVEKGAGLLELLGAGTLRQVAGDRHQVGPDPFDRFNERLGQ
jgi:hypothetical protein